MMLSMTGFATRSREFSGGVLSLELRAVNHRYFDLQVRLPEELRSIEPALREAVSAQVVRGKIECRISLTPSVATVPTLTLNRELISQLVAVSGELSALVPSCRPLSTGELLRWPGALVTQSLAPSVLQQLCVAELPALIDDFNATRAREGEKLAALLVERLVGIETLIAHIQPKLPAILAAWQGRLVGRLAEANVSLDDDRIKQEFSLFAQKIDVDEELGRLTAHVSEVRRVLRAGGQAGKRLDFLMQELNREANTLGSKSVSPETTQTSVELKVLIEQMREQIQNLE